MRFEIAIYFSGNSRYAFPSSHNVRLVPLESTPGGGCRLWRGRVSDNGRTLDGGGLWLARPRETLRPVGWDEIDSFPMAFAVAVVFGLWPGRDNDGRDNNGRDNDWRRVRGRCCC